MKRTQIPQIIALVLMTGIGTHALAAEPEVVLPPKAKHGLSVAKAERIGNEQLAKDPKVRAVLDDLDRLIDEINSIYESYINVAREDRNSSERAAKIKERDDKLKAVQARRAVLMAKYEEYKKNNTAYQALQKRAKDEHLANREATKKNTEKAKLDSKANED